MEDNSTIADLKSSLTMLQEAVEKSKSELQSMENNKVLQYLSYNLLSH